MTIPITPGPFSFLAEAGKAAGAFAEEKEKKRQQMLKEAKSVLDQMIELRQRELLPPEAFSTPQAMKIYAQLGIVPVSDKPTATETLHGAQGSYLTQLLPQLAPGQTPSDEARAAFGLPSRAVGPKTEAEIAQAGAAVPQAQLAGAQAQAQIPGAATTAVAGQQSEQDKQYNDIADRVVEALYARTGKLPTGPQAYAVGQGDERAKPFGTAITQPYYEQAVERLRQNLYKLQTERVGAEARARGAAGTGLDDLLKIHQAQQTRITAELNALPKPSDGDQRMADLANQLTAQGKPVPPIIAGPAQRVSDYNRRRAELEQQLQQSREQLDKMLGGPLNVPPANPPGTSGSPQRRAAAAEYEQRVRGITDQAKRKQIANDVAKKYGIQLGQP